MSKLYLTSYTDARKKQITSTGHSKLSVTLWYGSSGDSRKAIEATVQHSKDKGFTLEIQTPKGTETIQLEW